MDYNNNINSRSLPRFLKALSDADDDNLIILDKKIINFRSTLDKKQREAFEELAYLVTEYIEFISKKSYCDGMFEGMEISDTRFRNEIKSRRNDNKIK
ncbi:MAG: hypothetical protein IKW03_00375 [Clostridia bacterium]|nr:hypothetical protein [Clostridia bacterium]